MNAHEGADPVVIKVHGDCGKTSRVDVGKVSVEFECKSSSEGADSEDSQAPVSEGGLYDFPSLPDPMDTESGHAVRIEIPVPGWDMLQEMAGEDINLAAEPVVVEIFPGAEGATLGNAVARARSEHRRLILDVDLGHGPEHRDR